MLLSTSCMATRRLSAKLAALGAMPFCAASFHAVMLNVMSDLSTRYLQRTAVACHAFGWSGVGTARHTHPMPTPSCVTGPKVNDCSDGLVQLEVLMRHVDV